MPVLVHNNAGGADAAALKRFDEPAWNNPVLRFLDAQGRDLIPRRDSIYTPGAVAERALASLQAAHAAQPAWLELLALENTPEPQRATFAMHCFWVGEAQLGAIQGVTQTRVGQLDGREVVEVEFDARLLSFAALLERALEQGLAERVYASSAQQLAEARSRVGERAQSWTQPASDASRSDDKHSLRSSPLVWLPLTPLQRTKLNSALALGTPTETWLSPRQRALIEPIRAALRRAPSALDSLESAREAADLAAYDQALRLGLER